MAPSQVAPGDPSLEDELRRAIEGEVRFDAFTRGIYATDASHYQIEPIGVVFPRSIEDVQATLEIARAQGVPVLPRGGGTSQCGQTVGRAIVLDTNRHLRSVGLPEPDASGEAPPTRVEVEPGVVLDELNALLRPHGVWFPVDPSTGSRATLGGMAGNNSAGARSIRYGMMVDNVAALDVVLADGRRLRVGEGGNEAEAMPRELAALRALYQREADEIQRRTPHVMRNVAGYALDQLQPDKESIAGLLVGSEGTLAFFSKLRLKLSPLPRSRVLGVVHFPGLLEALDSVQHLVSLKPSAVELVDANVLRLAAERPTYQAAMRRFVRGNPGALLVVEFATSDADTTDLATQLRALDELVGEQGYPDSVVHATSPGDQAAVWSVRKAGLNIVMSMAGPRKPISFIEDCAVPLEHLAEYARSVDEIFRRHGTDGTWYAHASVGCLHVRPALNLKDPSDVGLVRRIAEETHSVVRRLGGTHSGEHGDGILRSEFLESMLGKRMTAAYREVKETLDPAGVMNPGKIVDPPPMDDRSLFRYHPGYEGRTLPVVLDWSASAGLLGATERCNNNGACRKLRPEVMCPSFRVTLDERHSTRGRANALRLALTGQLGDQGLDAPEMDEAMALCVSCKACRQECPAGVDMARMKLEWQHHRNRVSGVSPRERVLASLPRMAPLASRFRALSNLPLPGPLRARLGLAQDRPLPRWHADPWTDDEPLVAVHGPSENSPDADRRVALFVDTFTRWFDPETARATARLLQAGGWTTILPTAPSSRRPLCCGRTYLSAGMLDEARTEAARVVDALGPLARQGVPIVGMEPSCLYTLRDELPALLPGPDADAIAGQARLLEELLDEADAQGRPLPFGDQPGSVPPKPVVVHGHCHQKAFGGFDATVRMLGRVPGLSVSVIESSCCGMAGAFGYHAEHYDTSMAMAELSLLPAVRAAPEARVVANGISCRAQIADGAGRESVHAAVVLAEALALP